MTDWGQTHLITMRIHYLLCAALVWLAASCSGGQREQGRAVTGDTLTGKIQISGAFALYPLAVRWADEFRQLHPNVKIDISGGGAGKGMTDVLSQMVDIGMVSREVYPEERAKGALAIAVVKDAVVPTVNVNNPLYGELRKKGLSLMAAQDLWSGKYATWGQLLGTASDVPVHVFTRSDACGAAETFAAWLGKRQEDLKGTAVFGDPGVASAIQKDRVGIGFNNIAYVYDQKTQKPYEGLAVIPIDLDGNGRITADEDFYATSKRLTQAIKAGKFPSPPARDLYMVTKGKPGANTALAAFLRYVLTEGQKYAEETGYISLQKDQPGQELKKLN